MNLVIESWFEDEKTGVWRRYSVSVSKTSWPSVRELQRQRLAHYRHRPHERAEKIMSGFIVRSRGAFAGYRTVQRVTLESGVVWIF